MTLSYSDVAEIVKIVDSSNCDEVSLELEGAKILIRRKGASDPAPAQVSTAPAPAAAPAAAAASPAPESSAPVDSAAAPVSGNQVVAPMVGTYYSRPSPEEAEFVTVGAQVEVGTPLCIIEVMKLFTTIESTRAGTVKAILATDGQMVEYGQPLFVID
ncbi:Biotin carboxyl carrier protein of acetyl-CoA carboxylase (BCCP) [Roseobacter sp. AzwK-3b]|uniref:acetyl-CoA carboxylase biotin carboxyl carrier protein n=1 Tax=Roseobacter sp. AzwK-3b TaxID=351016 RepID=UPI000156AB8F|nr:acetyl-CoA carboxylase biotin carboxyl carrier protein [Roseobacter sp. AzwK-3b]EDM70135.1 Biotin carboxyl carrier protein of acetyl-CoA carboxylase (BCCP) [Roseobacter sp. AzwK-3b]